MPYFPGYALVMYTCVSSLWLMLLGNWQVLPLYRRPCAYMMQLTTGRLIICYAAMYSVVVLVVFWV